MAWFNKTRTLDPISERARLLNAQIAALEKQIERMNANVLSERHPRLRSTAVPQAQTVTQQPAPPACSSDPVFEGVNHNLLKAHDAPLLTPSHYNDLGVRKYDLAAAWRKMADHFSRPSASNPKLINYLAAGSLQGLRPLRYEKRVARNRLILLVIVLIVVLTGIFAAYFQRN